MNLEAKGHLPLRKAPGLLGAGLEDELESSGVPHAVWSQERACPVWTAHQPRTSSPSPQICSSQTLTPMVEDVAA